LFLDNYRKIMSKITKVLVANRGEIACRILRTLKRMGIPGAVVYHPVDAASPAVEMAAQAVEINGRSPVAAYLDMENIITACKKIQADALHPGFGFLSENADFARRLAAEGIDGQQTGSAHFLHGQWVSCPAVCI
jgi:acetyl-CoA/propionyl-CoA carboxylase, biotin carboxylase, biotin carboxyl carrier protein